MTHRRVCLSSLLQHHLTIWRNVHAIVQHCYYVIKKLHTNHPWLDSTTNGTIVWMDKVPQCRNLLLRKLPSKGRIFTCLLSGLSSRSVKRWKELRRFTLSTLRDFGMGKKAMSARVQEEVLCLVEAMATAKGLPKLSLLQAQFWSPSGQEQSQKVGFLLVMSQVFMNLFLLKNLAEL